MARPTIGRALGAAAVVAGVAAAAYPVLLRRWCLTWGATRAEVDRVLPGDDLLPRPDILSTRAVTIEAPGAIWPWLVQMGSGRGGAYTYDWIENPSASTCTAPTRSCPGSRTCASVTCCRSARIGPGMTVAVLERERALVFRSADGATGCAASRCWSETVTPGWSAVIASPPDVSMTGRLAGAMVMEPGSLVMERKMLLGLKSRAERTGRAAAEAPARRLRPA